jgi:heme exporter protein A
VVSLVELNDAAVMAGKAPIVKSITLRLDEGECLAIQGPNGAGKTTLLRVIATLVSTTQGSGRVLGAALGTDEIRKIRPLIGLAGHVPALAGPLTLFENLAFVADLCGRQRTEAGAALELVGLAGARDRRASHCSHGMLRRADLARLFLNPPRLLLLDEPHAGLDASAQPLISELVRRAVGAGGGAVLVSHDPTTLVDMADRRLTLRAGSLEPLR